MAQERSSDAAIGGPGSDVPAGPRELLDRLRDASAADQDRALLALVREEVTAVLDKPAGSALANTVAFRQLGVYGAIGARLRERLAAATGVRIPATLLFDHPSCVAVARFLAQALLGRAREVTQNRPRATAVDADPVVIVGMGCRYAGEVHTPADLWRLVESGTDAATEYPTDRGWDLDNLYDPDPDKVGRCCTRHAGFLHDAANFDAAFFGISPREAMGMDPQQRLLLEVAWEALESARIDPRSVAGRSGSVFVGVPYNHYGSALHNPAEGMHGYLLTGSLTSVASGRISYVLGLEGPAVTVDTACSSSLVALHLAAESLRRGECSLALAGGATVMSTPGVLMEFSRKRGLSPDGRCKAFSDDADGTGWGEGAGMLVLERLSDARAAGHQVLAVVAGSALNQDGASNGMTAPNGPAQQRVIRAALAAAGLSADEVDAVEAHGTGTPLGDPIEAQALLATYGQDRDAAHPLWLGSLKSNIGHTQGASGVGGVIKMVLAMRHGLLPASLHVSEPSTHVDWSAGAVQVLTESVPWPQRNRPRRAGVSSFGVSGTNAHVILAEAPQPALQSRTTPPSGHPGLVPVLSSENAVLPLVISGGGVPALAAQAARLREWLVADPELELADVARSLVHSRALLADRAVVIAGGDEPDAEATRPALAGLAALAQGEPATGVISGTADVDGKVVFVFPGQGAQWAGMAAGLLESSPVFTARIAECEQALAPFVDWSLTAVLHQHPDAPTLDRVDVVQPASWAVMIALAALWQSVGVHPDAVIGHSQGEIAAACVAGILTLNDGARVVALRSQALTSLAGRGGMLSVALPLAQVEELLLPWSGRLAIAAVNGPNSIVISGDPDALRQLHDSCTREQTRTRIIDVDYASHSAHVDAIQTRLDQALTGIDPRPGTVPMLSTVSGQWVTGTDLRADYWYRNLRQPVQFADAIQRLAGEQFRAFIECSSHPVLTTAVQQTLEIAIDGPTVVAGTLRRDDGGAHRFLSSAAEVFVRGPAVDWPALLPPDGPLIDLPTYAFQRQRYWLEAPQLDTHTHRPATTNEPIDASFWQAVHDQDLPGLAHRLNLAPATLTAVLPALQTWHHQHQTNHTIDTWRYKITWKKLPHHTTPTLTGTWLLITTNHQPHTTLTTTLTTHGATVHTLTLNPTTLTRDTITTQLQHHLTTTTPPTAILSLLATESGSCQDDPIVPVGLAANLLLLQALGDAGIDAPLWCVTTGAVAVNDHEVLEHPAQAATWGLGRVAALEYPKRWGGLIDLPATEEPTTDPHTLNQLCTALTATNNEDQLAIRTTGLYTRRLTRAPLPTTTPPRTWQPHGTILITGGTGALGAHVARWLATQGATHLILTSRQGPHAPGATQLLTELTQLGTHTTITACDLANRDDVAALVRDLEIGGHAIRSVIHTAGVAPLAPLSDLTVAELAEVAAGKVAGAHHLGELLDRASLETVVYFSSIAAIWGVGEHGAYAAANAYLDALAHNQRANGLAVHSVAWGPWAGGGMIADSLEDTLRRRGVPLIDPALSISALQQILDHDEPSVAVAEVDWQRFATIFCSARPSPLFDELPDLRQIIAEPGASASSKATEANAFLERLGTLSDLDRDRSLLELVRAHAARVLGHASPAAVDPQRAFMELGFDSLAVVELRNGINATTGLRLPATVVFDHPTPTLLAQFLRTELLGDPVPAADSSPPVRTVAVDDDPIAIIGMGCRYPGGVESPADLWKLVADGTDAISQMPTDRGWDLAKLYDPDPDAVGTSYTSAGGFLHEAADFDAAFFGISPREAMGMDPQQRLLLEVALDAIEGARISPASLKGSQTGVFVGMADQAYASRLQGSVDGNVEGYLVTGGAASVASGRISYVLGLEGPAVTVDTACSSSLVALHLAVESLRRGECSMALAGAAMVMSTPSQFVGFSRQRGLSVDGRCKAFSEGADGFGLAEGAGLVVLERLSVARAAGHRVLAVVAGSAVNQDGASNGLTAPSGLAQQRVIRAALASAGLVAGEVDAVEAHGTGTALGDPIEAQALLATYGQGRGGADPLWLGSVKSNIGHTQTASGVGGVIKMVLAMGHGVLPATLHVSEPSTRVDWSGGAVRLLTESVPWPRTGRPRRAGVSSFGVSGTNAHVILQQADPADQTDPVDQTDQTDQTEPVGQTGQVGLVEPADQAGLVGVSLPFVLSGRGAAAVAGQARRLRAWLVADPGLDLADVAWSLVSTRSVLADRAVLIAADRDTVLGELDGLSSGEVSASVVTGRAGPAGKVVFVFPGQGAQWAGMAAGLLESSPVFTARIAECEQALAPFVDWSLTAVLHQHPDAPTLDRVDVVQPASWAVMIALAALWQSVGVHPDAVIGHSQGEIAAACVAGILTLNDGARVVALRSQALTSLAGRGGMLSVALPPAQAHHRLTSWAGRLSIAAVNSPTSVVISGDIDALHQFQTSCVTDGIRVRLIEVDYASHSPHVDTIHDQLATALTGIHPHPATTEFRSTVGCDLTHTTPGSADYWYRNLRHPVQFQPTITTLTHDGYHTFIEISTHPITTTSIQETIENKAELETTATEDADILITGTLRRDDGGMSRFLTSAATAYTHGLPVQWPALFAGQHHIVDLPTYAFQRQRYWLEAPQLDTHTHRPATTNEPIDASFWQAVHDQDLPGLAHRLNLAPATLTAVLPALQTWHHQHQTNHTIDTWRYKITWKKLPHHTTPTLTGTWLLITTNHQPHTTLTTTLTTHGATVHTLTLNPTTLTRDTITTQLQHHLTTTTPPTAILSLLATEPGTDSDDHPLGAAFTATLALMQALGDAGIDAPLWCATTGAVSIGAPDPVSDPLQAQIWGLGIVAGLDDPQRWGGLIDLPATEEPTTDPHTLNQLCTALTATNNEDQLAIRTTGLYTRRLTRAPLPTTTPPRTWQPHGTILITGGTGALGAHVARWLATQGATHLILTSRQGPHAPGATQLLTELTQLGTHTTITACDLANRDDVERMLATAQADGPLSAVVHAAGVTGLEQSLGESSLEQIMAVAGAKVAGARHLDELLSDTPLDAFIMFASGAGVWGNAGQSAYAAANAYLEALAHNRRDRGQAATCVSWGAWDGGGMVGDQEAARLARLGILTMRPEQALIGLRGALDHDETALVLADIDWHRFGPLYSASRPRPLLSELTEASAEPAERADTTEPGDDSGLAARLTALPSSQRQRELLRLVRTLAAVTLGHPNPDEVRAARPFRELGFDSLTAVDLRNRLNAVIGLALPVSTVFDHPTPAALAQQLNSMLATTQPETTLLLPLDALDRLEPALAALDADTDVRRQVAGRLRGMLRRWEQDVEDPSTAELAELSTITDDDMFELIDLELGTS